MFAPFAIRSFRFQWMADLTMSWATEMETLILGWYGGGASVVVVRSEQCPVTRPESWKRSVA